MLSREDHTPQQDAPPVRSPKLGEGSAAMHLQCIRRHFTPRAPPQSRETPPRSLARPQNLGLQAGNLAVEGHHIGGGFVGGVQAALQLPSLQLQHPYVVVALLQRQRACLDARWQTQQQLGSE